jgi:hypothetical protein
MELFERKVMDLRPDRHEMKKLRDPQLVEKLVSNYVVPGTRLRLRGDVLQQMKEREWIFIKVKDQMVFLIHETKACTIAVEIEDIDWTAF